MKNSEKKSLKKQMGLRKTISNELIKDLISLFQKNYIYKTLGWNIYENLFLKKRMSTYSYVYIFSNPCSEADSNNNNNGNNKKIINLYLIFL